MLLKTWEAYPGREAMRGRRKRDKKSKNKLEQGVEREHSSDENKT
ncbi:uncharacterized protein G2W53_017547 [Senna tora]|uniref:Uncharacterized protein n=1 Tax=Senna tora TaxID=362788 RepID=A0A834WMJ7_9FABA|nr:uncharacterized protein G2W53_017547 [Senna tora]